MALSLAVCLQPRLLPNTWSVAGTARAGLCSAPMVQVSQATFSTWLIRMGLSDI